MTEQAIEAINELNAGARRSIIDRARAEYAGDASARRLTEERYFVDDALRQAGVPRLRPNELDGVIAATTAAAASPTRYMAQSPVDTLTRQSAELSEVRSLLSAILTQLGVDAPERFGAVDLPGLLDKIRTMKEASKRATSTIPSGHRYGPSRPIYGHVNIPPGRNW